MLFPTGFAANLGVLTTFAGPDVLVCSDELNHASIIDGRRLAGAPLAVYRHCDVAHVDELLRDVRPRRARIVVTETVFSMDGDVAPVDELVEVCARHGALLVLDEAHAVLGPDARRRRRDADVLRVGTLSKTLGALGGFVAGPARFTDLLVNRARSYIFTTASTPADTAAALAARRASCGRPRATRCAPACAPTSTRSAPATRRRSCRSCAATSRRALDAAAALARRRAARHRDPAADGAAGHVAPAGRAVGRAHRRAGRPARAPRSPHVPVTARRPP